jgi:hypothetical protein
MNLDLVTAMYRSAHLNKKRRGATEVLEGLSRGFYFNKFAD